MATGASPWLRSPWLTRMAARWPSTRATDKAGRSADTANVVVDVTAPELFTATTSLLGGALISPSQVVTELNARISWPAVAGAVSVYAGWTVSPTATLNTLTTYGAVAGNHDQALPEGSVRYAHVVAVDGVGNQREYSVGPFYFDSAQTPDAIADLNHEDWLDSGGKQVGQMSTAEHGTQKLFAGWDASQLRLRWEGANLSSDGDLYLYLGTGSGGTTDLYNPYGPSQSGVLPFAANYLVRLSDGITPTLLAYSGSWITQTEVAALSNGTLNDVVLSFADLGISNPAGTTLKVLGVASTKDALNVWATLPDKNLGQSWNQFIQFSSLGSGIVPSAGVWADAQLEAKVLASPAAGVVGAGDSVSLTVAVQNVGSASLPQLSVNGSTSGGATLNNAPQTANNLPVSGTVELTLNGTINADGAIVLTLADSYHRAYQLTTLDYTVDLTPPSNVTVASSYANPGSNTAYGFAQDESSIRRFDLEVNGTLTACTPFGFAYQCLWDAGSATEGSSFSLRGKATDSYGNEAWSDVKSVQVDSTPPTLALSAASQTALSDGRLSNAELGLTGSLTDTVAANSAQLCSDGNNCTAQAVLADGSWTLFAPTLGDGVTTTLSIVGDDVAGNLSQPLTKTVLVDSVAPVFGPTTINQGVFISNVAVLLGYGTVSDGDGVAGVQLYVVRPDGSSTIVPATLNGANWTGSFLFDQVGVYQVVAVATDLAGNQATQVVGEVTAQFAVIPPQSYLLTVRVVGSGVVTPSLSSYISGTVVPITATANPGWSFAAWSGAVVTTTNPTSLKLDADKTITATFTQNSYTVTSAAVGNGTIQIAPQQSSYRYGDVITLTATAATGSAFSGWSGDLVSSSNPVTLTVTSNKAITGSFALQSYTLTLNQMGTGTGTLSNTPSGTSFAYGTVVTVTATANANSFFAGWSGAVTSSSNAVTLTMDSHKTLTATFSRLSDYTLTVNIVGNGLVTPTTSSYLSGTVVPITATAATGWSFTGWSGDLSGNSSPTSITLNSNKVVTATFTQDVVVPSGDINGDASVNVIDLQLTINMIQAGSQPNTTLYALEWWQRADLNHDSQWNVLDLQLLINLIFAANAALVAPQDRLGTQGVGNTVTTGLETSGSFSLLLDNSDAIASVSCTLPMTPHWASKSPVSR
ncbi:MAG: dockerin type I domain-containing protein [Caldilineaceae bacterium]